MEKEEMLLIELYDKYNSMPLATQTTPAVLYDKGFVIHTGMAFVPPHPHRYYTFEEFCDAYTTNDKFRDFMIHSANPLT